MFPLYHDTSVMTSISVGEWGSDERTVLLGPPPHHGVVWVLQQETDGHERQALVAVCVDGHPAAVTLVHVGPAHAQHARDAGPTQVHVQDAHLTQEIALLQMGVVLRQQDGKSALVKAITMT